MNLKEFFYTEVMELYKTVTIPLEETGIQLDVQLLQQTKNDISFDIMRLEKLIQDSIAPHLDTFKTWFLNKDFPMKTWLGNQTLVGKMWEKHPSVSPEEFQLRQWQKLGETYMFNLQSKHHLKKLFFDTLGEKPLSKTPTGQPQVNEEFLEQMALKYDWAAKLITLNRLSKLKSTYIDRLLEENEEGIFYPSFMQHRTVSGRYGSDIQQLPRPLGEESGELERKYTNLIRSFILPRAGNVLLSADYAQLEPRVFCHVSGDDALKDIFNNSNDDFYSIIAKRTEGLSLVSKEARQRAKAYALGIPYGLTGYKLQFELNITQKQGDELVSSYFQAFPKLKEWFDESLQKAVTLGMVKTETGRVRRLRMAKEFYDKYGTTILDDLSLWSRYHDSPTLYAEAKAARKTFKNLVNNARNFQIQGLGASIINRAAIAVNRTLKANNLKARLIAQIHDELVYDVPESEVETVTKLVRDCMQNNTKLSVPLIAKPVVAKRYSDCK